MMAVTGADTAYKNGTLQVAYFILALRALGLDAGRRSSHR